MTDRLQEIRARLGALPTDRPWHVLEISAFLPYVVGDIAWLLAEVERLRGDEPVAQNVTDQERP